MADEERLWQRRCRRLWEWLGERPVEAALIVVPANVRYLTGFTGDSTYLLVASGVAIAISDGRYEQQLQEECPGLELVIRGTTGEPMEEAVGRAVRRIGAGRIGYEPHGLTCDRFQRLQMALPGIDWQPMEQVVEQLRAVKDAEEIGRIREAIAVAERAIGAALEQVDLRAQPTECRFAGVLNMCMRELGAEDEAFETIVACGARAALPHARLSRTARLRLEHGVLCDWGARVEGYVSDLTRLIAGPKIAAPLQRLVDAVLAARDAAIARLRPGVPARSVDAEARKVLDEAGFGRFFKHSTGHGIGLEVHEAPLLRPNSDVELRSGMVVTIEPGVYLPGRYGVRIEEDVLVTEQGPEVLTSLPPVIVLT